MQSAKELNVIFKFAHFSFYIGLAIKEALVSVDDDIISILLFFRQHATGKETEDEHKQLPDPDGWNFGRGLAAAVAVVAGVGAAILLAPEAAAAAAVVGVAAGATAVFTLFSKPSAGSGAAGGAPDGA